MTNNCKNIVIHSPVHNNDKLISMLNRHNGQQVALVFLRKIQLGLAAWRFLYFVGLYNKFCQIVHILVDWMNLLRDAYFLY